ncbi:MAG: VTC domain-containing protein [Thermoleophilia bacterium]|nr:VTC domain-containing protein [Thermoleophilia bacterium]
MRPTTAPICPSNLHISQASPASTAPSLRERVEQKFFIHPSREGLAFALLRRTCREDPEYPVGQVNSLYFDTTDLEQHERSASGDHAKDKVRIRWYGDEHDPHRGNGGGGHPAQETAKVWLELKSRRGFASTKQRADMSVPGAVLGRDALTQGIVSPTRLVRTMAGFGFFARGRLCPVIAVTYWRYRFIEPLTGFRISIDSHVRSTIVMPGIGHGERGLELPGAVVEIKGPVFDVPPSLREIAEIGSPWTRYSKYSASLDGHGAAQGSVSRLWPPGVMDAGPGVLSWSDSNKEATGARPAVTAPRSIE